MNMSSLEVINAWTGRTPLHRLFYTVTSKDLLNEWIELDRKNRKQCSYVLCVDGWMRHTVWHALSRKALNKNESNHTDTTRASKTTWVNQTWEFGPRFLVVFLISVEECTVPSLLWALLQQYLGGWHETRTQGFPKSLLSFTVCVCGVTVSVLPESKAVLVWTLTNTGAGTGQELRLISHSS